LIFKLFLNSIVFHFCPICRSFLVLSFNLWNLIIFLQSIIANHIELKIRSFPETIPVYLLVKESSLFIEHLEMAIQQFFLALCFGLAFSKPQLDTLKNLGSKVTGLLDGCAEKESSFITNPQVGWWDIIIIILCSIDSGDVDARSTPLSESSHRYVFGQRRLLLPWQTVPFCNPRLKNCRHGWGFEPRTLDLSSLSGPFDYSARATP